MAKTAVAHAGNINGIIAGFPASRHRMAALQFLFQHTATSMPTPERW